MENDEINISVCMDTKEAEACIVSMTQAIKALGMFATTIGASMVKSFSGIATGMKNVENSLYATTDAMVLLTQQMSDLVVLQGQTQSGGWLDGLSTASDISTIIQTLITLMDELVITKIKNRAEDLKIIVINTVEHVKAFGLLIAQLAASAGAWITETAAKVANTAATWAQNAATSAWQVICVAATAVTTAFGAAVTFLTSPIGLVIIAITALIAIVVLLVQNWDTVKAAERYGRKMAVVRGGY